MREPRTQSCFPEFKGTSVSYWTKMLRSKRKAAWTDDHNDIFMQRDLWVYAAPCLITVCQTWGTCHRTCKIRSSSLPGNCRPPSCGSWLWSENFCASFSLAVSWRWPYPSLQNNVMLCCRCSWVKVSAPPPFLIEGVLAWSEGYERFWRQRDFSRDRGSAQEGKAELKRCGALVISF